MGDDGSPALLLTLSVPFALDSMAHAELDINAHTLRLRGPGVGNSVEVPVPSGFALDPDRASAKFSKRRQQLVVSSPNLFERAESDAEALPQLESAVPPGRTESTVAPQATSGLHPAPSEVSILTPPTASPALGGCNDDDDDDDDDLPPPLEGAHSVTARSSPSVPDSRPPPPKPAAGDNSVHLPEGGETNEAAETLMKNALAAREQKRREAEASRQSADLSGGSGLKKGFLSGGGKPKRRGGSAGGAPKADVAEEVPYIAGCGDAEEARRKSLQLPEVQQAVRQQMSQMQEDASWVTPQLLQALQTRPDLLKGMSDPKIKEAIALMQKDPEEAKRRFEGNPEVTSFLKDFSSLMATHFDVLAAGAGKTAPNSAAGVGAAAARAAALPPSDSAAIATAPQEALVIEDPQVQEALRDPEVQRLIAEVRAGRNLEMRELCRENPRLFVRLKVLLDKGVLAMTT